MRGLLLDNIKNNLKQPSPAQSTDPGPGGGSAGRPARRAGREVEFARDVGRGRRSVRM